MPLTLSCLDLGSPCDTTVSGESIDEIVEQMRQHAIKVHNQPEAKIYSDETAVKFRSLIKQSSRPASMRTQKLDI